MMEQAEQQRDTERARERDATERAMAYMKLQVGSEREREQEEKYCGSLALSQ